MTYMPSEQRAHRAHLALSQRALTARSTGATCFSDRKVARVASLHALCAFIRASTSSRNDRGHIGSVCTQAMSTNSPLNYGGGIGTPHVGHTTDVVFQSRNLSKSGATPAHHDLALASPALSGETGRITSSSRSSATSIATVSRRDSSSAIASSSATKSEATSTTPVPPQSGESSRSSDIRTLLSRLVSWVRRHRRGLLVALVLNEVRGLLMTAPVWIALWHHWVRH